MPIELQADLDLDAVPPGLLADRMSALEARQVPLVTLSASRFCQDSIRQSLCALRAAGLSALLLLKAEGVPSDTESILVFLEFLRDWDQLLLRNVLEVTIEKIPPKYRSALQQEARTELKWFQEWQTAVSDPRIHRYPGLPWRRFLRKVNAENYAFVRETLLDDGSESERDAAVKAFLVSKKKTVCIFPKNWGKR